MKTVITHNGRFHADEVLACATLDLIYDQISVIRTRDPQLIHKYSQEGAIVVDVGEEYNPSKNLFDHHQSDFQLYYSSKARKMGIPLSSCGLVYLNYREDLLTPFLSQYHYQPSSEQLANLEETIYFSCYSEFDAGDNGVQIKSYLNGKNFYLNSHLISLITAMNGDTNDHLKQLDQFKKAMEILKTYLYHKIDQIVSKNIEFNRIRDKIYPEQLRSPILVLDEDLKDYGNIRTLKAVLKSLDIQKNLLFVIVFNKGIYRLYTMTGNSGGSSQRAPLITKEEAENEVGDQLSFIHPKRFTGGCKSLESAIEVARLSLIHYEKGKRSIPLQYKVATSVAMVGVVGIVWRKLSKKK